MKDFHSDSPGDRKLLINLLKINFRARPGGQRSVLPLFPPLPAMVFWITSAPSPANFFPGDEKNCKKEGECLIDDGWPVLIKCKVSLIIFW